MRKGVKEELVEIQYRGVETKTLQSLYIDPQLNDYNVNTKDLNA